jgi:hypothetical protein
MRYHHYESAERRLLLEVVLESANRQTPLLGHRVEIAQAYFSRVHETQTAKGYSHVDGQ